MSNPVAAVIALGQQTVANIQSTITRDGLKKSSLFYSDLNGKDKTTQLNLLTNLEKNAGNVLEIIYKLTAKNSDKFSVDTWKNPEYMKYDSTINFNKLIHPTGADSVSYALKLFCYIDIPTDGSYIFANNKTTTGVTYFPLLNLFLNGYKILDNISTTNEVYLKKGTYLLYIEFGNTDENINLTLNLKGSKSTTSIDTFISKTTPYKLLSNITTSRDDAIVKYCTDHAKLLTVGNVCDTSLKNNELLKDRVQATCFERGDSKKNLFTGTDGKLNSNCKNIVVNTNNVYNKTISDNAKQKYTEWANRVVTDNTINDNKDRLEEYLNTIKPNETVFGFNDNMKTYCENNSKDSYNILTSDTLCTNIYNRTYTGNNLINKNNSLNTIKNNYCSGKDANGNFRYETDSNCKNDYTGLLKDTIQSRCLKDGKYKGDDKWCDTLIDNNITSNVEPYKSIIAARNNLIKTKIDSTTPTQTTPLLDTNTYNYVIGKYNDSTSKKLSEELLNQKLYDYCETKEPNYPTIDNSQCKGIYNKFNNEQGIKDSQKRMQESLCKESTNITTSNPNDGKTNAYLCKDTIFNTTDNLAKFAETVATHCATNINAPECTNYYNNIEDKILQQYIQPNVIPTKTVSNFSNKNKDTLLHEYQNVVLESYENGTESTNPTSATESTESTSETESSNDAESTESMDFIPAVESNLIILSEENNNEMLYYILVFVFVLLMITLIYSCSCNKKKSNNNEKIPMAAEVKTGP